MDFESKFTLNIYLLCLLDHRLQYNNNTVLYFAHFLYFFTVLYFYTEVKFEVEDSIRVLISIRLLLHGASVSADSRVKCNLVQA
jgi:hypothetical protein